jgi:O-acetyl-ADP-ribose deacetylase (regulator of RNase III)
LVAVLGEMLTRQGDIEKAVAAYAEAQKLDPTMEIPAIVGNNLCWWGSLWGHAADVMEACETAVALEPENRKFRDSRGLARALTGNIAGAIEDFQAFIEWTDDEERRLKRQHWLEALRAGENPFTEEEIESLFNEQIVADPQALEELKVRQNQISSVEAVRNLAEVGDVEGGALSEAILLAKRDAQASKGIASASSAQAICDRLSSERSIDYTRLRDLLAAGRWKEADQETTAIMLRVSSREAEGWLREEDIEKFPCTDLLTIDQLWVKYSEGRFGFSVQKRIWENLGGTNNAHIEIFGSFCERVGWRIRDRYWLFYSDLTFNTTAPVGHLPGGLLDWLWLSFKDRERDGSVWWNIISSITSRLSQSAPAPITIAHQRLMATASNESGEGFLGEFLVHNKLIKIYQGDITNLVTDVIVSSDDNYLTMGGGVSQRIRQIGGEDIYREVRNLIPLSLGEVAVTTAGNLRARKIFHAVVIDFDESEGLSDKVIQRLVHTCMKKANRYRFQSIAFPLLGTGAGGLPAKAVWEIMLGQIISDLSDKNQNIIEVIICLHATKILEELKIINFLDAIEKFGWKSIL